MRYFFHAGTVHKVPAGTRPEDAGVDSRMALEVSRLPRPYERWVGPARGWQVDKVVKARCERDAELRDPAYVERLEARLAALEAFLADRSSM
jgi:hypothetical protein